MRFLVVGLGSMGARRIRNLQFLQAGTIVGMDPREDRRQRAAEKYDVVSWATLEEAMAVRPDAIIISTPPDFHDHYMWRAAELGVSFFCEASVEARGRGELARLCEERGILAAPSFTFRCHPQIKRLKHLVDSGAIGRVVAFTYQSGQYLPDWHPWEHIRDYYVSKRETGACREMVPFELLWLCWIMGEVTAVSCFKDKLAGLEADIDDVYQLLLRFESGALGHLLVDVVARTPVRVCRFTGDRGVLEWDAGRKQVRLFRAGAGAWEEYSDEEQVVEPGYVNAENMYIEEMRHFLAALQGKSTYPFSLREEERILSLLQAAEASAQQGRHVRSHGARRAEDRGTSHV
ncbi:MAG: Gfo/Idh/MocA family oxidoreductase [Candidatus Schekmanbacteria bacterium]|nr:Gfo/Idh/MocA family oxidoreductase [Candidatus Schekmanbacteria bacterium]